MGRAYIGTSGWNYKHWAGGVFYHKELKPSNWLEFFARTFDTVEINNSFYRLPSEAAFQSWRSQVPSGFMFAVKASRFLTHIKRLKEPEGPLDLFFSRAKHLREKLGPVLFQLPPRFTLDIERLETFLRALRRGRGRKNFRAAIEVRDESWMAPAAFELLRAHNVALCFADWRDMPVTGPITADFVYIRRHYGQASGGNYGKSELNRDIEQCRRWLYEDLDVFVYFNNDIGGHAVGNARYVQQALRSNVPAT